MNITFTGAQSSGKTTLLKAMKTEAGILDKFFYIDEVTRKIRNEYGRAINEEGANDITQLLIINEELKNLFIHTNVPPWPGCAGVVHDRCLLDGLVYTEYFFRKKMVSQYVWQQALQYWYKFYDRYDIIFYPDPHEIELVDDGERSTDVAFRNDIIDMYEDYYLKQSPWRDRICVLKGTVEQRLQDIKIVINEHTTRQQ